MDLAFVVAQGLGGEGDGVFAEAQGLANRWWALHPEKPGTTKQGPRATNGSSIRWRWRELVCCWMGGWMDGLEGRWVGEWGVNQEKI